MGTVPGYALTTGTWHLPGFVEVNGLGGLWGWDAWHIRGLACVIHKIREKNLSVNTQVKVCVNRCNTEQIGVFLQIPQIVLKVPRCIFSPLFTVPPQIKYYLLPRRIFSRTGVPLDRPHVWKRKLQRSYGCLKRQNQFLWLKVSLLTWEKHRCPWLTSQKMMKLWYFQGGDTQPIRRKNVAKFCTIEI